MAGSKETWDVFQERESRSNQANDLKGGWPHVSWVVCGCLLSSDRERLAREATGYDVNHALIYAGVPFRDECSDIAVDWCVIE
jgi:hypothetical protein